MKSHIFFQTGYRQDPLKTCSTTTSYMELTKDCLGVLLGLITI